MCVLVCVGVLLQSCITHTVQNMAHTQIKIHVDGVFVILLIHK